MIPEGLTPIDVHRHFNRFTHVPDDVDTNKQKYPIVDYNGTNTLSARLTFSPKHHDASFCKKLLFQTTIEKNGKSYSISVNYWKK